jgi:hypothetical protein
MVETFGTFLDQPLEQMEYLLIGFSASSLPIQQRWKTNRLSADFISDYLRNFFTGIGVTESAQDFISIHSDNAVKYISNELLENAMKFHDDNETRQTRIGFYISGDQLIFLLQNMANLQTTEDLRHFIQRLLHSNPYDLYIEQMEKNAMDESSHHSGLGLLSMICDYGAKLGWKLESPDENGSANYKVSTMISLPLKTKS